MKPQLILQLIIVVTNSTFNQNTATTNGLKIVEWHNSQWTEGRRGGTTYELIGLNINDLQQGDFRGKSNIQDGCQIQCLDYTKFNIFYLGCRICGNAIFQEYSFISFCLVFGVDRKIKIPATMIYQTFTCISYSILWLPRDFCFIQFIFYFTYIEVAFCFNLNYTSLDCHFPNLFVFGNS